MKNDHSTEKTKLTQHTKKTQKNLAEILAPGWVQNLGDEFSKPYMESLRSFLRTELQNGHQFFPPANKIFRALKLVDYDHVRVVIVGQDPYHGDNQANGLAFAVEQNIQSPPSLQNIFKEIALSYSLPKNFVFDKTLENWAMQGVLCVNTVLTVRKNLAFSHRDKGWEIFTDRIIECIFQKTTPVVFLCWGASATAKINKVSNTIKSKKPHFILEAPHPSPLSAYRGFFGCGHFIKTNEFLKNNGYEPIKWA